MTAHKLRTTLTLFYVTEGSSLLFFSSRRLHTRSLRDWSSDVCSSDLKRGLETVGERLSLSDTGRGRDLLDQAGARLDEVDTLLGRDASDAQVAATLRSFTSSAGDGADLLFRSYQRDGDDGDIAAVRDFAGTEMGRLTALSATAPDALQPDFAEAAQLLSDVDQQATALCG